MSIDDLYNKLLPYAGKPFAIPGDIFPSSGFIGSFCQNMLNFNVLTIDVAQDGVKESGDKQSVTLNGTTASYGFGTFDIAIVFTLNNNQYQGQLSVKFTGQPLALPGVSWITLTDPEFSFTVTDTAQPIAGSVAGTIQVNGENITLSMAVPNADGYWVFTGDFDPILSIKEVIQVVGGIDISTVLQSPFSDIASDLGVKNIGFTMNTTTATRESTTVAVGTPTDWSGWTFAPNIAITSANLLVTIDGANNKSYDITSSLNIAGIDVFLSALYPGGNEGWIFSGQTGKDEHILLTGLFSSLCSLWGVTLPSNFPTIYFTNLFFSFNASQSSFLFGGELDITNSQQFSIAGNEFTLKFDLQVGSVKSGGNQSYQGFMNSMLQVGQSQFDVNYDFSNSDKQLTAFWKETDDDVLDLADIAQTFGNADLVTLLSDIPPNMDLALTSASFTYDFTNSELVLSASSKNYGNVVFVAAKLTAGWAYAFMVAIDEINLTNLPLVGDELGKLGTFEIEAFKLLVSSADIAQGDVQTINGLIETASKNTGVSLPTLPDGKDGVKKGAGLSMTFKAEAIGYSFNVPVSVGTAKASSASGQQAAQLPAATVPVTSDSQLPAKATTAVSDGDNVQSANAYWINIQKALGPVYMDKIGFTYQGGDFTAIFNFSLNLGSLSITLNELSVASPLKKFDPVFNLQGLSVTFKAGSVEISGGFLKQTVQVDGKDVTEYNGEALIKVGTFSLSAMGSYANVDGQTSLFIFAMITAPPLGGPPYLFITGVAAGFGYNRGLKIPLIDGVASFPLTAGFAPGGTSPFSSSDPGKALQVLVQNDVVPIKIGQDWVAAGIQFTSFEMLKSYALVAVEFGTELEIALLGMTTASVPTGDPNPLIFAQLALDVRILPDEGLVAVDAQLTSNSYLLEPSCHLTGGFALYIWFGSNAHAGDFVVTLGGYHPNFKAPDWYPKVPLLGFNWQVTSELLIKGGMYFALTPTCVMAGGSMEAVWQSGGLKAWFDMGADFLISWKPYHYEADLYISFGVSYTFEIDLLFTTVTETISVSLGADLSIWGPSFSGVAHIHLWIISFSIDFGAGASQAPPAISWQEFEESFVPKTSSQTKSVQQNAMYATQFMAMPAATAPQADTSTNMCGVSVKNGLSKDLKPGTDNPNNYDWLVKRQGAVFSTTAFSPSKSCTINFVDTSGTKASLVYDPIQKTLTITGNVIITNPDALKGINILFGVGPVDVDSSDFHSDHTVEFKYDESTFSDKVFFQVTAVIQNSPKALWQKGAADLSPDTLVGNVLIGVEITTGVITPDETTEIDMAILGVLNYDYASPLTWPAPTVVTGPPQPLDPIGQLESTIGNNPNRSPILQSLVFNSFDVNEKVDVSRMAQQAGDFLLAPPIFEYNYWKQGS